MLCVPRFATEGRVKHLARDASLNTWLARGARLLSRAQARETMVLLDGAMSGHVEATKALLGPVTAKNCRSPLQAGLLSFPALRIGCWYLHGSKEKAWVNV